MKIINLSSLEIKFDLFYKITPHKNDSFLLKITKYALFILTAPIAILSDLVIQTTNLFRKKVSPPPPPTNFEIACRTALIAANITISIFCSIRTFNAGFAAFDSLLSRSLVLFCKNYFTGIGYGLAALAAKEIIRNVSASYFENKDISLDFNKKKMMIIATEPLTGMGFNAIGQGLGKTKELITGIYHAYSKN